VGSDSPKPEDRDLPASGNDDAARERVRSLTEKKPSSDPVRTSDEDPAKPRLTEKQRIEARRARQAKRRRKAPEGNVLSKGMRATGFEIRRTASFIGGAIIAGLAALGPVFSAAGMGLVWLIDQTGKGLGALRRLTGRLLAALGGLVRALDRALTPQRALILVAAIGSVLLAVSQFKGLGQIEIGQAGYYGFEDLARAPAIDHTTPAGVHTKILVPLAAVALAAVAVILLGSISSTAKRFARFRRLASMLLVTIGVLSLIVALLVDLPDATDTTEASLAYSGVKAVLLSGFWLELAAGATLTVTGIALLFAPQAGRARQPRPESSSGPEDPAESRRRRQAERAASRGSGPAAGPATGSHA
jgi:hypothetical protein